MTLLWNFHPYTCKVQFIDETGMSLGFTRLYGRAPKGERLYDTEAPGNPGQNISLIGGMSIDGLIVTFSVVGRVNTNELLTIVFPLMMRWAGSLTVAYSFENRCNLPITEALKLATA